MTEYAVLEALKSTILNHINDLLPVGAEAITEDHITIGYPDIDNSKRNVMIFITPNEAQYESKTWGSDISTFYVETYVLCKKDTNENLTQRVFMYANALYKLLRTNQNLDGTIDFSLVTNLDFFPAIDALSRTVAIDLSLSLSYEKTFSDN